MWELDHKEGCVLNDWWLLTVELERTMGSPLGSKEIKTVNPKGNQPWIFIGQNEAEAEVSILWPLYAKRWLTGKKKKKNLMLGKIEGKRRSGQKWKRWLDSITHSTEMNLSKLWEIVKDRGAWHSAVHGVTESDVSWGLKNNSKGLRLCLQGLSCLPLNSQRSPFQAWWMRQIP